MYKDCGGIAVVKIAVNNDLKHYSLIIRNTKAYKTTKNIAILMGALFLINSAGLVIDTARTHRPQPFLILLVSAFFLLFAAYMIRLLVRMDPMKLHKKVMEANPGLTGEYTFNDEGIIIGIKTDNGSKHAEYAYDKFISAAEKEGLFLINISIAGYVACNAEDFIEGTPDELRALLRAKLGDKYKEK